MAAQQGSLPEKADFAAMEEKVMGMWKTIDAFKTSLKLSEGKPEVCNARSRVVVIDPRREMPRCLRASAAQLELPTHSDFLAAVPPVSDFVQFIFYDGPPFATGLPHYGHILAGTIKDIVTRYATQVSSASCTIAAASCVQLLGRCFGNLLIPRLCAGIADGPLRVASLRMGLPRPAGRV
jgi:hypothetical protein